MILDVAWNPCALLDVCLMKLTFRDMMLVLPCQAERKQREEAIIVMWLCACSLCSLSSYSITYCAPNFFSVT